MYKYLVLPTVSGNGVVMKVECDKCGKSYTVIANGAHPERECRYCGHEFTDNTYDVVDEGSADIVFDMMLGLLSQGSIDEVLPRLREIVDIGERASEYCNERHIGQDECIDRLTYMNREGLTFDEVFPPDTDESGDVSRYMHRKDGKPLKPHKRKGRRQNAIGFVTHSERRRWQ